MDLYCLLVAHGKRCPGCAANGRLQFPPKDGSKLKCPLANLASVSAAITKGTEDAGSNVKRTKLEGEQARGCVNTIGKIVVKQEADLNCTNMVKQEVNDAKFSAVQQEADLIGSHDLK